MLQALQNKFNRMQNIDIDAIFMRVMAYPEMKEAMIAANQAQMYDLGVDSKGASLGEYTPFTIMMKQVKEQRFDHITLLDSGDFYNSMEIAEKDTKSVVITADMQKADQNLEDRWPDALGLTQESINNLRPLFQSLFMIEFRKVINNILYGSNQAA